MKRPGQTSRSPWALAVGIYLASKTAITFFLFFFCVSSSNGEEAYLNITVTIPSRLPEPIKDISGSISVITPDRIEEEDPIVPTETLRDTPGLITRESGTIGEQMTVRLRSMERFHTLVMIDGIKVNSPFRSDFDFGDLLMDGIEQIEIIRGSQSALYGSEAIGGVIDLKTRSGKAAREFSIKSEIGNNATFRQALRMQGKADRTDYSFSASRVDTQGELKRDSFHGMTFAGKLGYSPTAESDLRLTTLYNRSKKELGTDVIEFAVPVQVLSDENNLVKRDLILSSIAADLKPVKWLQISVKGSILDSDLVNDNPIDPGAVSPNFFFMDTDETRFSGEIQTDLLISDYDVITTGLLFEREEVDAELQGLLIDLLLGSNSLSSIRSKRDNRAYYIQNLFKIEDRFVLQAGARLDYNSDFGSIINPKASSSYIISPTDTKIRGSFGRGFRAPSIQELEFPVFGNPALDPERSTSYEIGLDQYLFSKEMTLSATYFYIFIKDLIQVDPTILSLVNIGEATSKGVELETSLKPFNPLKLRGNYTYFKAEDRATGEELPRRSKSKWYLNLLYLPTPAFTLNIDINIVSSQAIEVDFIALDGSLLSGRSPGYTRVDLTASYDLLKRVGIFKDTQFFFKVNNLFDADIMEVPGFPAAGINFLAGLKVYL